MMRSKKLEAAALTAVIAATALLSGCRDGSADGGSPAEAAPAATPHGHIPGAEETAEQQSRLVLADAASGTVRILDPATGAITPVATAHRPRGIAGDGRFAYVATAGGTHVVDSGAWTVDHGDHVHHYRAEARDLGEIRGKRAAGVHSDTALTAVSYDDASTGLFDREALQDGRLGQPEPGPGTGSGSVVPYRGHLLVPGTGPGRDTVEVRDRHSDRVTALGERCGRTSGAAVTRRGVVLGCADGALLVSEKSGVFTGKKIAYPAVTDARDRAVGFRHRPGGTTLTAVAGGDGVWLLDVSGAGWKRVRTGPVVAANTAGEGAPLLALSPDGVLTAYDPATGEETARRRLVSPSSAGTRDGGAAVIEVDTSRAYINDSSAKKVYEIDYNDGLRVARTFPLGFAPTHMVETGR
ncbi:hypothetical protein [Streptomyces sp. NPDC004726]